MKLPTITDFHKFAKSPYFKALHYYPGNLLLSHWQDAKRLVWEELSKLEETPKLKGLKEELLSLNDPDKFFQYMISKYKEITSKD